VNSLWLVALKRFWTSDRPLKWAGLFFFEFIVVLLGVLCAQLLQERFEVRREAKRFETIQALMDDQMRGVATMILTRGLQVPCVDEKLERVLAALDRNERADLSQTIKHPVRASGRLSIWSGDVPSLARKYVSAKDMNFYEYMATVSEFVDRDATREDSLWAVLALAEQGGAGMSDVEKAEVRKAAYQLEHAYEGFDKAAVALAPRFQKLGTPPSLKTIHAQHQGKAPCADQVRSGLRQYGTNKARAAAPARN
jgi:hypothetical protein